VTGGERDGNNVPLGLSRAVAFSHSIKFREEAKAQFRRRASAVPTKYKSTAEARPAIDKQLIWTSSAVPHAALVGLLPRQTKFINYVNVFWRIALSRGADVASVSTEFGTTLARRLNQSRVFAVVQSNLIEIKFGKAEARRLNWA